MKNLTIKICESEIIIKETTCFRCGTGGSPENLMTQHHSIPQAFKPKNNVVVPICTKCHQEMNQKNPNLMNRLLYKIMKMIQSLIPNKKPLKIEEEPLHQKI